MSSLPGIGGSKGRYSLSPADRRHADRSKGIGGKPLAATYTGAPAQSLPSASRADLVSESAHTSVSARTPPSLQYLQAPQDALGTTAPTSLSHAKHDDHTFLTEAPMSARAVAGTTVDGSGEKGASYSLGPVGSQAAAQKIETAERWRSQLLKYEADLRELVATGSSLPPSTDRVMEAIRIYDGIARIANTESPHLGEMLRLLRIEFSRAVFSGYRLDFTQEDGPVGDLTTTSAIGAAYQGPRDDADLDTAVTYFDQVTSLLRENAGLQSEIALGNTRERIVQLTQQVDALSETVRMYENEIGRLTRQNQHTMEECRKARTDLQEYKAATETQQVEMSKEIQALNVENKDMQLQIFRLRKQIGGGRSRLLKDTYRQMKLSKMSTMASMFDEGDERVGILIFLSQLESRVNELLDTFDAEYLLTAENAKASVQRQFAQIVAVLLEEEHLCRAQYRRLVPETGNHTAEEDGDETDGFVALLFDEKIYESFLSRETIRRRLVAGAQRLRDEEEQLRRGGKPRDSGADLRAGFAFAQPGHEKSAVSKVNNDTAGRSPRESRLSLVSHMLPASGGADGTSLSTPHLQPQLVSASPRTDGVAGGSDGRRLLGAPPAPPSLAGGANAGPLRAASPVMPDQTFEELVQSRKAAWVKNIFGTSASAELVKKYVRGVPVVELAGQSSEDAEAGPTTAPISSNALMARVLQRPLQDLSSSKFVSSFDVYTGRDPAQQKFLCSVNFVSPATPIQLPELTNFVKVKYTSSIEGDRTQGPADGVASTTGGVPPAAYRTSAVGTSSLLTVGPAAGVDVRGGGRRMVSAAGKAATATASGPRAAAGEAARASMLHEVSQWGGATPFSCATPAAVSTQDNALFHANENLRVFHELGAVTKTTATLGGAAASRGHKAGAVSSTTALTVAFQRLNPLSPNRGPEWSVYKDLFGGYRTLTPRLLEVSTVDHIFLRACERHYQRMMYRYETCLMEANQRSTNSQMALTTAERFFNDSYVLTDFQESVVDELESRYGYPELVAKNLYEILCYLDAMAEKDGMFAVYLDVVRGFKSPTAIHYTLYMLYQMSYGWPTSNPLAEVSREEVSTVLQYMYRDSASILRVDVNELLNEYDMATRSAPITFMTMRSYLSQVMLHNEEALLLYFNGLFNRNTADEAANGVGFEAYMDIITKYWQPKSERTCLVRFLSTALGFNRNSLLTVSDCAHLALSSWCSGLW